MRFILVGISYDMSTDLLEYEILDLKDGVVETYEYFDLLDIINTTGVKIDTGCLDGIIKSCSDLHSQELFISNGRCKYRSFYNHDENEEFFVRLQLCEVRNKFVIDIFKLKTGRVFKGEIDASNKYYSQVLDMTDDLEMSTSISFSGIIDDNMRFMIEEYFTLEGDRQHVVRKSISVGYKDGKFKGIKDTEFKVRY